MPLRLTVTLTPRKLQSTDTQHSKHRHVKTFSTVFGLRRRSSSSEPDTTQPLTPKICTSDPQSPLYSPSTSSSPDSEYGVRRAMDFEDGFGLTEPSYPYLHEPGSHVGDGRMLSTIFESAYETSGLPSDDPPPYYKHEDNQHESDTHLPTAGKGTKRRWGSVSGRRWSWGKRLDLGDASVPLDSSYDDERNSRGTAEFSREMWMTK